MGQVPSFDKCVPASQHAADHIDRSELLTDETTRLSLYAVHNSPTPMQVKPLLLDLDQYFKTHADASGKLRAKDLTRIWQRNAGKKCGKLTELDRHCIQNCINIYFDTFNIDPLDGSVDLTQFMTFMLGGLDSRGAFGSLHKKLRNALSVDPTALHRVYAAFECADLDKSGTLDLDELIQATKKIDNTCNSEKAAKELLNDMDIDGDGKVDYYEFLSYSLGRRKAPVELIMYDISNGISNYFSLILLGQQFEAIYHTGVLVFGYEYWFGGELFQNEPPMRQVFGDPLVTSKVGLKLSQYPEAAAKGLHTYHLGYTLSSRNESLHYLNSVLSKRYTSENYDVINHNCNTFSDDFVFFLTGNHIPQAVRTLPELAMNAPIARLMRPLLNTYLGGFGSPDQAATEDGVPILDTDSFNQSTIEDISKEMLSRSSKVSMGEMMIQIIPAKLYKEDSMRPSVSSEYSLAQVLRVYPENESQPENLLMDLRWFNPITSKFVEEIGLPKARVKKAVAEPDDDGFRSKATIALAGLIAIQHERDTIVSSECHEEMTQQREELSLLIRESIGSKMSTVMEGGQEFQETALPAVVS